MPRTTASIRGAIYTTLTTPQIQYQIDLNTPQTLASTSVYPHAVFAPTAGGTSIVFPAVFIDVSDRGTKSEVIYGAGMFGVKLWVVSAIGPDECTAIYEAVDARLNYGDIAAGWDAPDLSTPGGVSSLPLIFHQLKRTRASGAAYELETTKWYVVAEYDGVAT